ncbi:hypothetical protein BKA63DRAFT_495815 [Paraphoma chrysanthemicola]|nr:hypothetical protein BKA63DRAFT_495815 [Paraphoma chrysanthemicola]
MSTSTSTIGEAPKPRRSAEEHEDAPEPKKLCRALCNGPPVTSEPVTILVGEHEERFFVHSHLLETSSEYFLKALSIKKEAGIQMATVKLPDTDADAFSMFAKWLYTARFYLPDNAEDCRSPSPSLAPDGSQSSQLDLHWEELCTCYSLADSLQSSDFADATIDAFLERMIRRRQAPSDLAEWIYPRTAKESVHRKLGRDIALHSWSRNKFDRIWKEDFPREFLEDVFADVTSKLSRGLKQQNVAEFLQNKTGCEYHEHKRLDLPCYKTSFGVRA